MKRALAIVSIVGLSFSIAYAETPDLSHSQSAIHAFNQGVQAFNGGKFNEAVPFFDEAISQDSDFAEAYYARGACRYSLRSVDGATMDLSDAIRLKSSLLDARSLRGVIYYETEHWDSALEDFNAVLTTNPKDPQSLLGRGVILLKREDVDGATRDFRRFLRVRPNDPMAPRLRQLLAKLGGKGPSEEAPPPESSGGEQTQAPRQHAVRRPSADVQALADSLMRKHHDLSDAYTQSVIRGQPAPVIGDPTMGAGGSSESKGSSGSGGVDIVDPQSNK